jgi:DNA repair exonuclease SbcCD ATPase subunit
MSKKPTSRSTKAEILAAYKELAKEKTSLESQIRQLNQPPKTSVSTKSKSPEIMSDLSPKTEQQRMKNTIDLLMKLQLGFGSSVSDLSEKLTIEASQLEELRDRVDEEIAQLTELHDLSEVDDETLDTLIDEYERSHTQFETEFGDRKDSLEQEFFNLIKAWQKEKEDYLAQISERNEEYRKTTQRESTEYQYELELQRHLDTQQYAQSQEERYRELEEMKQEQEKAWEEREKAIADRERLFEECKQKVEAHPKELESTIKRGKETGRNIAHYQAKVKADLKQKEVDGQKQFFDLRLHSLETSIRDRETRIQSLTKQLESALKQVQDLAVKAIEGSANANSLQAVKDIALEQAKNQPRSK